MSQSVEGLTDAVAKPPERVLVRMRGGDATLSAWRLEVTFHAGTGWIVLIEPSPNEVYYRGEGAFLGWPQPRLAAVYQSFAPTGPSESADSPQLG